LLGSSKGLRCFCVRCPVERKQLCLGRGTPSLGEDGIVLEAVPEGVFCNWVIAVHEYFLVVFKGESVVGQELLSLADDGVLAGVVVHGR